MTIEEVKQEAKQEIYTYIILLVLGITLVAIILSYDFFFNN